MIAANKNLLKANLTQGVLGIQSALITLYSSNLIAIATQAALIAGFAFQALTTPQDMSTPVLEALGYVWYICFTICFISTIIILSQATLVVTYGPSMALKGSGQDAVKVAAKFMFQQELFIYRIAFVSITALFLGACIFTWAIYSIGLAIIISVFYAIGYYILVSQALAVYAEFEESLTDTFEEDSGQSKNIFSKAYKSLKGNSNENNQQKESTAAAAAVASNIDATRLKARGTIWVRESFDNGGSGLFVKYYANLEKGKLDFYKNSKSFQNGSNPINERAHKLWELDLETDSTKYERKLTSMRNALTLTFVGSDDFSMQDMMTSEYDLKAAAKKFKFALIPKLQSELTVNDPVEMLAHDEVSYNQWIEALKTVTLAYDSISSAAEAERNIRSGALDVETIVLAANKLQ